MKSIQLVLAACLIFVCTNVLSAQKIYNPNADAKKDITEAVAKAKKEGKHVLVSLVH